MKRKTSLALAVSGTLMGLGSLAQAAPAVVAGAAPGATAYAVPGAYGHSAQYGMPAPPPAPLNTEDPGLRTGHVWLPGHWLVLDGKYRWQSGQWLPERPGYSWQAPEWRQRSDGLWYMVGGNWVRTDDYAVGRRMDPVPNRERDRDGDGVPDRFDRFRQDPRRY